MNVTTPRLVILILFLTMFLWCKAELASQLPESGRLAAYDAPNSIFGYLTFGAFKPLFLQYLWSKADRLQREGRFWELIDIQERIVRLQPHDPQIRLRQGQLIAFGVAQSEPNEAKRWRYYQRALRRLGSGIKANPKSFELREMRFYVYFDLIAPDRYCSRQLQNKSGRSGLMAALADAVSIAADFPKEIAAFDLKLRATEEASEWLMNRGRFRQAAELLDELAKMARSFADQFPKAQRPEEWEGTYRFWAHSLRQLDSLADWHGANGPLIKDGAALLDLLRQVGDRLELGTHLRFNVEGETLDANMVNLIHLRAMGLCQSLLLAKKHEASLRYRQQINRISVLAEGRIGPQMPYYSVAYVNLFEKFVSLDADLVAALQAGKKDVQLRARWQKELVKLDQLIRKRAGRTDSFKERLIQARH